MSRLHLVFKSRAQCLAESIVSLFSGSVIHVDIVPQRGPDCLGSYTSYMGESFSINRPRYDPYGYKALTLSVTDAECMETEKFLQDLVLREVPYNTMDLAYCVLPYASRLITDVQSECKTVYCSQAIVLCLRHCVKANEKLTEALQRLNSRCTSPQLLHDTMLPFCKENTEFHTEITFLPLFQSDPPSASGASQDPPALTPE